ncbi:hypothetical protein BCR33DRAFT_765803 [Rhizoclosmatium globosum]|uniref:ABC transporter domain-containing protein n=1 Tax=Rhizoclosmatium globosum TaxID=329046 RepID=A0A1Y2CCW8_9FUNG|nr:hypothetical protein BCR33DRAFT_765803 [Rhizoclosmatium globosum]|eukprot:ORY44747.1 hypothetical protein BCR33DRAFT_765803 [Rhizoclosmatium globosum]
MGSSWLLQVRALTAKNCRVIARKPLLLLTAILFPLLAFVVLGQVLSMLVAAANIQPVVEIGQTAAPLPQLPSNTNVFFVSNVTATPSGVAIMKRMCELNKISFDQQVRQIDLNYGFEYSLADLILRDYRRLNEGPWFIVRWEGTETQPSYSVNIPNDQRTLKAYSSVFSFQQAVDGAILSYNKNPTSAGNDVYSVSYDFFQPAGTGFDEFNDVKIQTEYKPADLQWIQQLVLVTLGPLAFLPLMILTIDIVAKEKQRRLYGVLRRMGLMESAFWISLFVPMALVAALSAVSASVGTYIQYNSIALLKVNFDVLVIFNYAFALAMLGFACFISSIVSKPLHVNISIGVVAVASIIVNVVLFLDTSLIANNGFPIPPSAYWFSACDAVYAQILLAIFAPFYNYGRVWVDVVLINNPNYNAPGVFDMNQLLRTERRVEGTYQDDGNPNLYKFFGLAPTITTVLIMACSPLFHVTLSWYLNQIISSEEGFKRTWTFPFTAAYWTGKYVSKEFSKGDTLASEKQKSYTTNTMRMIKMTKSYNSTTAVKEFSSVLKRGKSIPFWVITVLENCFMFGLDIREDAAKLQSLMSLCPQFDVLYSSLSPYQHLQFYYMFRGDRFSSKAALNQKIMDKLEAVNLADVAHVPCSRFSGGMKRRLSLCLATIAENAKIIFLDEPTTGLDPISRRGVWKVIQSLKKDRIVVLTTHSMEEADQLGDHVCIMHMGKLRASGSSLFLKNRFGDGFQVTLVNRSDSAGKLSGEAHKSLEEYVKYALPRSNIVSSAGGALTVAVGKLERGRLVSFLRALKKDVQLEWTLGNSTLEEVFLKLCAQNKTVVTAETEAADKPVPICRICAINPTEAVFLYTKSGVRIEIPDVVCKNCADNVEKSPNQESNNEILDLITFSEFKQRVPAQATNVTKNGIDIQVSPKPSIAGQLKAIFTKNVFLFSKERRTNIGFVCFLVIALAAGLYTSSTFPKAPSNCTSGLWFKKSYFGYTCSTFDLATGIKNPTSGPSAPSGVCMSDSFSPPISSSPNSNTGQSLGSMGSPVSCSGGSRQLFGYASASAKVIGIQSRPYSSSYNMYAPDAQSVINSTGSSFTGGESRVVYSQTSVAGDQPVSSFFRNAVTSTTKNDSLVGIPSSGPMPGPMGSSSFNTLQLPTFDSISGNVQDYFLVQQKNLVSNETSTEQSCPAYYQQSFSSSGRKGLITSSFAQFQSLWQQYYPDLGINFNRLQFGSGDLNVNYQVVVYADKQFPAIFAPPSAVQTYSRDTFPDCAAILHSQYSTGNSYSAYPLLDPFVVSINSVTNSILQQTSKNIKGVQVAIYQNFPKVIDVNGPDSNGALIQFKFSRAIFVMFFILATGLMFPRLVSLIALEKSENLVEMMRIQGLSLPSYWAGNYLFGFFSVALLTLLYVALSFAVGSGDVVRAGFALMALVVVVWTHAQVCLAFFIGGTVSKPMSASLISYMLFIVSAGISPFMLLSIGPSGLSYAWNLYPIAGAVNLLVLVTSFGTIDTKLVLINTGLLIVCSTFLALLGMYVHAIKPSKVGIPLDPLLGLSGAVKRSSAHRVKGVDHEEIEFGYKKDTEVLKHEKDVQTLHSKGTFTQPVIDEGEALRVVHLRKEFGNGKKVAVKDMTLSVKYGETFGLLGPNGAGKTTALSMMTGLLKRSGGDIVVAGHSIQEDKISKTRDIGITPQFDTVWPELTVEETLSFYCSLRGVKSLDAKGMVRSIAESIELDGDAFKQKASQLSGGMRRRLSIGIALTANPKILVLDEPTTGLDPETRRQIWMIVDKVRRGGDKAVIITTHSMDEADALCTRIGIVVDGEIKVLGSQMTLKKQYAEGLKFTFRFQVKHRLSDGTNLDAFKLSQGARTNEISAAISQAIGLSDLHWAIVSSDLEFSHSESIATTTADLTGSVSWMVSLQCVTERGLDVAETFVVVSKETEKLGVEDWALHETTLEDVFVKVAESS